MLFTESMRASERQLPAHKHPVARRNILSHRPLSVAQEERFVDDVAHGGKDVVLLIVRKEGDEPIGVTGLHELDARHRRCTFGILVGESDARGKGHGTGDAPLERGYSAVLAAARS